MNAKKQTIRCQYGLCAAQWSKVNLTYKKGTKVYGKVVKSGVHQGTVTIKL